jgi:hypothetical protein
MLITNSVSDQFENKCDKRNLNFGRPGAMS